MAAAPAAELMTWPNCVREARQHIYISYRVYNVRNRRNIGIVWPPVLRGGGVSGGRAFPKNLLGFYCQPIHAMYIRGVDEIGSKKTTFVKQKATRHTTAANNAAAIGRKSTNYAGRELKQLLIDCNRLVLSSMKLLLHGRESL